MKKQISKLIAILLIAVMALSACSKTGGENTDSNSDTQSGNSTTISDSGSKTPKSDISDTNEIVEITVMVYDRGQEFSAGNSLTDNVLTRWVNERMEPQGVHVTYVPVPRSGADNEVNLMLAAGTAPDIIRTYDRQRVATYGSQGGLVDLGPYLDRFTTDYVTKNQDAIDWCKFDGAQYAIPGVYVYHGKSHETYLREDLVKGMGMEMPKTRDELIKVLYAMKDNYPDITPYAFSGKITDGNYTNFLLSYTSRANERDNYIYEPTFTIVLKPGHKEGLKQLNRFVLDGIIDPNFALDTDSTLYNQAIANGKVGFVMDGSAACIDAYETAEDPNYRMVEVDTLENADGSYEVPSQDAFSHYVYVPKTAEDRIEAVMKYLNFLSEEQNAIEISYGIIGYGAALGDDGSPVGRSKTDKLAAGTSGNPSDSNFLVTNFEFEMDKKVDNWLASTPHAPKDVIEHKVESQYSNYFDKCLIGSALKTDEYVPLLQTLIVEFVFKCMNAPEGKFDEVYDAEYQILVDNHLQEVLDERAAWYDANH